eukprot:7876610-Pyramimonas_sp.AAC.2
MELRSPHVACADVVSSLVAGALKVPPRPNRSHSRSRLRTRISFNIRLRVIHYRSTHTIYNTTRQERIRADTGTDGFIPCL